MNESKKTDISVRFISHNRKPKSAPNPAYPNGIDIDLAGNAKSACVAKLPYPAECCGVFAVKCHRCGYFGVITTAGRVDDPRTVKLPCSLLTETKGETE